ncbi:MAG: TCR/Tet family MFS transporter [Planctomycetaceae bacterium]|nr:TCR/Tet family MFS transporter [Planctomycetaceae bacterium]
MSRPAEDPVSPSFLDTPRRKAAIVFILVTLFLDILSIGIIIPVLPKLVLEFAGGDTSWAGWYVGVIGAVYSLMQFLFAPILGALSDRFGRRPVLLVSMFGLGLDFIVQGLAPNIVWLFVGRLLAGIMGASFSTANAYIADVSTPETRARNYGLSGVMFGLGFIFGPALGGLLGSQNLRIPFFVAAGLSLVNWLYGYWILPESLPREKRSSFTLAKANPLKTVERLQAYPLVAGLALAFCFMSLAHRGLENVWVLFMHYRFGWDPQKNGLALGLVGVMAALVQGLLVARIISSLGERRTILLGLLISTLTFLCYSLATAGWMIPVIIVFGAFGGVTGPALQSLVAETVESSDQGKIQGALTSLVSLTNIIAPLFFTAGLFSYFTSEEAIFKFPGAPFLVGACLLLAAFGISLQVFRKSPPN